MKDRRYKLISLLRAKLLIALAAIALMLSSCEAREQSKPQTSGEGEGRVRNRWGIMESARETKEKANRETERQNQLLQNLQQEADKP